MCIARLGALAVLSFCLVLATCSSRTLAAGPLSEQDLLKLIELGIDANVIAEKITKDGISFVADEAATDRLKKAGAGDAVLAATKKASPSPSGGAAAPITFQDVTGLLQMGIDESAILQRLQRSPTQFILSQAQIDELKRLKASDKLIAAMQGKAAPAGPAAGAAAPAAPRAGSGAEAYVIVLDCSGSMSERMPDGQTKMEAAKTAVRNVFTRIPSGKRLAFVIYGHDRALACEAVKVARPMGTLDDAGKAELIRMVDALQPVGGTPIALSLRTAGQEILKAEVSCGLLLITDGLESCKGNPAAEAAALAKLPNMKGFGVDVIGLGVKPEEQAALKSIADSSGGKFVAANNAGELVAAVNEQAKAVAPVVEVVQGRFVHVPEPKIAFPPMKYLILFRTGTNDKVATYEKYGDIRLPGSAGYDVWWYPEEAGEAILLAKNVSIAETGRFHVKLEEVCGMIEVTGDGDPGGWMTVYPAGDKRHSQKIQATNAYNKRMVVPVGKYDVWKYQGLLEEGVVVEPGKVKRIAG